MTWRCNMAWWHRAAYAVTGIGLIAWAATGGSARVLTISLGIILILEAVLGH